MTTPVNDTIRTIAQPYRCLVTTNPVGTDTERLGFECDCQVCRASREIDRLNAVIENEAIVSREALAEVERLRCSPDTASAPVVSKLPSERELTELLRSKMCGPHQECDDAHPCTCRDGAAAVLALITSGQPQEAGG